MVSQSSVFEVKEDCWSVRVQRSPAVAAAPTVGNGVQVAAQLLLSGWKLAHFAAQFVCSNATPGRAPGKTCLFVIQELIKMQF